MGAAVKRFHFTGIRYTGIRSSSGRSKRGLADAIAGRRRGRKQRSVAAVGDFLNKTDDASLERGSLDPHEGPREPYPLSGGKELGYIFRIGSGRFSLATRPPARG